jgi:uncharacterized protein
MVEIDPFDPESTPVKRTHLGRFAHEGVVFAPGREGRPVVAYSGDDARFEYIYKFVSSAPYDPATADGSLLDEGTLYVAKFNDDGTGEWLALAPGENGLTPENGFADLADILVNTRLAADQAGRDQDGPAGMGRGRSRTGEVYFTLTNNTRRTRRRWTWPTRGRRTSSATSSAGARRMTTTPPPPSPGISSSSPATTANSATFAAQALDETTSSPAPTASGSTPTAGVDPDRHRRERAEQGPASPSSATTRCSAPNPVTGEIRRFLTGPIGQEITGVVTTPDQRRCSSTSSTRVRRPPEDEFAAGALNSHWPDGGDACRARPRS